MELMSSSVVSENVTFIKIILDLVRRHKYVFIYFFVCVFKITLLFI